MDPNEASARKVPGTNGFARIDGAMFPELYASQDGKRPAATIVRLMLQPIVSRA